MLGCILVSITILVQALNVDSYAFHRTVGKWSSSTSTSTSNVIVSRTYSSPNDDFDGKEFEDVLKSMGPSWNPKISGVTDNKLMDELRQEQKDKAEEIFRVYPYTDIDLPVLPDCNNYYSGKFGEYFWHQNNDQVYLYIPVDDDIDKYDIEAKFLAKSVSVKIKGKDEIEFECLERIIPDGSFWIFEADQKTGKKYVQLDMEKRFRMINWKSLFGVAVEEDVSAIGKRSEMLEKLFAANKGMAKLTGTPAEGMDEMISNEDIVKMVSAKIYDKPEISYESDSTEFDFPDEDADVTEFPDPEFDTGDRDRIVGSGLQADDMDFNDEIIDVDASVDNSTNEGSDGDDGDDDGSDDSGDDGGDSGDDSSE